VSSARPVTDRRTGVGPAADAFAARLLAAAGSAGWVVLFDEVELIGRYSLLQRAKSYAEYGQVDAGRPWWQGGPDRRGVRDDGRLRGRSHHERNDRESIPAKLRAKDTPEATALATAAELGMRIIDREMHLLTPPDEAELKQAYDRLRELHGQAFGWQPSDVAGLERLGATRMRQYVRAWINEWDLARLYPGYRPETETVDVQSDYREDPDLERSEPE
jgi:hypothetical protein